MTSGSRIGPYEIVRPLGAGAMGEVVLARDDRLDRRVALKSLPEAFARDDDRLARFEREARLLAALHHPHVASLFGLEELDGRTYLVMEYVEGETLALRIARGAVDLGEATKLAEQIARGLAAAHDKGIIHRDLKPGNVMVTPAGQAKVVDFGLAKDVNRSALEDSGLRSGSAADPTVVQTRPSDDDLDRAPTVVSPTEMAQTVDAVDGSSDPLATEPGVVLGTAAYMSPEQARGQPVDRRSDVWAFGCVVFEMLTRRRPFQGENLMQTLTAVLQTEPPWDALPAYTPPALERLLRRCLRKDPDDRLRDLGDAALVLRDLRSGGLPEATAGSGVAAWASRRALVVAFVALVALAVSLGLVAASWRDQDPPWPAVRFTYPTPDLDWGSVLQCNLAVSPDGSAWVYLSDGPDGSHLVLRRLGDDEPVPIAGTDDATNPFFSPDGRHLGFIRGKELLRIELSQGSPRVLATVEEGGLVGMPSWGRDRSILYATLPVSVFRIDQEGGDPVRILGPDRIPGTTFLAWPEHVGDAGDFVIFGMIGDRQEAYLVSADGSSSRLLAGVDSRSVFVEPDLLVFVRQRRVLAQRIDLASATLVGEPVELADSLAWDQRTGNAGFAVTGELLVLAQQEHRARMQWFDAATGTPGEVLGEPADLFSFRISPQGDRVAVGIAETSGGAEDLWIFDLEREVGTRITHTPAIEVMPVWSPDGRRIAYSTDAAGTPDVAIREADASGSETVLVNTGDAIFTTDWLPDGSAVVFHDFPAFNLFLAPVDGSPPRLWLDAPGAQHRVRASPDSRWLAFRSTELGTREIYAAPLTDSGRRIRISTNGAREVRLGSRRSEPLFQRRARSLRSRHRYQSLPRGGDAAHRPAGGSARSHRFARHHARRHPSPPRAPRRKPSASQHSGARRLAARVADRRVGIAGSLVDQFG